MIYGSLEENGSLDDLAPTVGKTIAALKAIRRQFDVLLVTGMSGVIVGVPAALDLDVPVVIVRKPSDDTHQYRGRIGEHKTINGGKMHPGVRAVIVDDFGSSGSTQRRLMDVARAAGATVVATYWYHHDEIVQHNREEELPEYAPLPEFKPLQPYPTGQWLTDWVTS